MMGGDGAMLLQSSCLIFINQRTDAEFQTIAHHKETRTEPEATGAAASDLRNTIGDPPQATAGG